MKYKVLLDTSVLVSASVYYVSRDWNITIKHPFYQQSIELIGFLKRHVAKRIGIITKTIEDQALLVIEDAVKKELKKKDIDRVRDFRIYSAILNSCEMRLNGILSYMLREPIDPDKFRECYARVDDMYEKLVEEAVRMRTKRSVDSWRDRVAKRFQPLAREIFRLSERRQNQQLWNLLFNPIKKSDKIILAEAVYLSDLYRRTEGDIQFYLSSTDAHFSPIRFRGGMESKNVTDKIMELFGIICEWPQQITSLLKTGQ